MGKTLRGGIGHRTPPRAQQNAAAGVGLPAVVDVERVLPSPTTVSVIVPTADRHHRHEGLYNQFQHQDYPDRDLWILDDSGSPSPFFQRLGDSDPRVHYVHNPHRQPIGCKRNKLIEMSGGACLAHFDDDDGYSPRYLSSMLSRLRDWDADLVKLGVWDERREASPRRSRYRGRSDDDLWGYGFSYVYRRSVAKRVSFPCVNGGEDFGFIRGMWGAGLKTSLVWDGSDWAYHLLHARNTSRRQ
jgi:glycosyltransferase involved in cell wall biosynthesis